MTTISSYDLELAYETSFDRKEGDKQKTYEKERDAAGDRAAFATSMAILSRSYFILSLTSRAQLRILICLI